MKVVVKKKLEKVPTRFNPSCTTTTHPSIQRLLTKSQSFLRETMKHLLAWVSHCWLSQYCTALTVVSESHVLKRQDVSNLVIQGGWLVLVSSTNSLLNDDQPPNCTETTQVSPKIYYIHGQGVRIKLEECDGQF